MIPGHVHSVHPLLCFSVTFEAKGDVANKQKSAAKTLRNIHQKEREVEEGGSALYLVR